MAKSHFGNVLEMFEFLGISASGKRNSSKAKAAGRKTLIDFLYFFMEEFMVYLSLLVSNG